MKLRYTPVLSRHEVLTLVCRFRRSRDQCYKGSIFERGMGAAFHLTAHRLWRELHNGL